MCDPDSITIYKTYMNHFVYTGPVPVVLRPYAKLDAKVKTIPIEVYGGVKCKYAENFAVGYYYDKKQGKSYQIQERKVLSKGCTKELKINEFQSKGAKCPVAKLGMFLMFL